MFGWFGLVLLVGCDNRNFSYLNFWFFNCLFVIRFVIWLNIVVRFLFDLVYLDCFYLIWIIIYLVNLDCYFGLSFIWLIIICLNLDYYLFGFGLLFIWIWFVFWLNCLLVCCSVKKNVKLNLNYTQSPLLFFIEKISNLFATEKGDCCRIKWILRDGYHDLGGKKKSRWIWK